MLRQEEQIGRLNLISKNIQWFVDVLLTTTYATFVFTLFPEPPILLQHHYASRFWPKMTAWFVFGIIEVVLLIHCYKGQEIGHREHWF